MPANPAPARPCVGRWPFAPVLASGQTLRSATLQKIFTPRRKGAKAQRSNKIHFPSASSAVESGCVLATLRLGVEFPLHGNEMRLKIAQPFMAGFTFRKRPKSRPGTVESFANTGHSFVPAGTYLIGLNNDPAINGWAIFVAFPSAVGAASL